MSRSAARRNRPQNIPNLGNSQEREGLVCPTCARPLAHDDPYLKQLRNGPTKRDIERRLARDKEFAECYRALMELGRSKFKPKETRERSYAIVKDHPDLAAEVTASDEEVRARGIRGRFKNQVRFGILRYREGWCRGFPTALPRKCPPHDRIFPDFDLLEWVLVPGEMTQRGWRPIAKSLSKTTVAAMASRRVSWVDPAIKKGFLHPLPENQAPTRTEAWFRTEEVMEWLVIEAAMRNYREPQP